MLFRSDMWVRFPSPAFLMQSCRFGPFVKAEGEGYAAVLYFPTVPERDSFSAALLRGSLFPGDFGCGKAQRKSSFNRKRFATCINKVNMLK